MLVALEGIDGAGKATQAKLLARRARAGGLSVEVLAFPRYGRTFFSGAVRDLLGGGFGEANDPRLVGLLFAGDRLESRPLLEERLAAVDLVVVDRYVASNLAYQAARAARAGGAEAGGAEAGSVAAFLEAVEHDVFGLPRPELTVLYDLPVAVAAERLAARAPAGGRPERDAYEADRDLLEACRRSYLTLADRRSDWVVIDTVTTSGPLPPAEVAEATWRALEACRGD